MRRRARCAAHAPAPPAAGCYVLALDPPGARLAVGGADAVVSVWDTDVLACSHTVGARRAGGRGAGRPRSAHTNHTNSATPQGRLEKPVRALSFSHDARFLAAGSQDHFVDVSEAATGAVAARVETRAEINSLAWNPQHLVLAYAVGDEVRLNEEGLAVEARAGGEGALRLWS